MGRGMQVGDARRTALYFPGQSLIDGNQWSGQEPISIANGTNKIVSSQFELIQDHSKDFHIIVLCPLIVTLNAAGRSKTSVCRGISKALVGTGFVVFSIKRTIQDCSAFQY